jgi:hypothetical protein
MRLPGPKNPENWQNLHRLAKLGLVLGNMLTSSYRSTLARVLGPNTTLYSFAVVPAKLRIKVGRDACEITQSFEVSSTVHIAFIVGQHEPEAFPSCIRSRLLHRIEEPDQFTEGKRPTRGFLRKAEFSVVLVKHPILDQRPRRSRSQANDVRCSSLRESLKSSSESWSSFPAA